MLFIPRNRTFASLRASPPGWRDRLAAGPWQAMPRLGSKMKRLLRHTTCAAGEPRRQPACPAAQIRRLINCHETLWKAWPETQKPDRGPVDRRGSRGCPGHRRVQLVQLVRLLVGRWQFHCAVLATKQGYETWAAYQNAHGGILGRQVKLNFLSDGSSPTQVITNYQKLITVNHVDFVMGPYSTLLTKPASAIANRYNYVMIEGIGGGPSVFQQGLHNVFDVSASATFQLITFAKWLASTQQPEKVAYAAMTDPFLQPMLDGARSYLTAHGFQSAVYKLYPLETTDFTPIASAITASKAQDR